ncbi:MAG: patatin-like phospholipase family protein [Ilumatobacteraceae bacterium]
MPHEPRRALVLAGGGIRVAWQAGVVQALDEAGLTFAHGDGTSGGIFTLGMLMSGVPPSELGSRWRTLPVRRFVSLLPIRSYVRWPTSWAAFGGAKGIRTGVLPHLGVDLTAIRRSDEIPDTTGTTGATGVSGMTGTFNVADFDSKTCVAIPHDEIDLDRLIAGVSLPIFLPAVQSGGRTWTDAVWIKDANLLESVNRGCTELWLVWCIGNTPLWGMGALEQYVHMIELSANSALFAELAQIADINVRRGRGEEVMGSTEPVVLHIVKPELPLPLDPDFVAGRISAEALVAMGYRDAWRYLSTRSATGVDLDDSATRMRVAPLGCRISLRLRGSVSGPAGRRHRLVASTIIEVADLRAFVDRPATGVDAVGGIDSSVWGYRPFVSGSVAVTDGEAGRLVELAATVRVDGEPVQIVISTTVPARSARRWRWRAARDWSISLVGADGRDSGTARLATRDALRVLYMFEPSGAHTLTDRVRALRMMVGFLRTR